MKFPSFATRIDTRGKFGEQLAIETAAHEFRRELRRVHADQARVDSRRATALRQRNRRLAPEREDGLEAGAGEQSLAVSAYVGQKKVAERDRAEIRMALTSRLDPGQKGRLVRDVRAFGVENDLRERQMQRLCLRIEQGATDAVNADTIEAPRHTGEKSDHLDAGSRRQRGKGEGAVFPTAPAQDYIQGHFQRGFRCRRPGDYGALSGYRRKRDRSLSGAAAGVRVT